MQDVHCGHIYMNISYSAGICMHGNSGALSMKKLSRFSLETCR